MKIYSLIFVLAVAKAQRPGYLGGPVGYPELAHRFRNSTTTTVSPDLGNRLGDTVVPKIPVDARGDVDLVNRISNEWPRKNWPFWLLNADHIEKQRNSTGQQSANAGSVQRPENGVTGSQASPNLEQRFGESQAEGASGLPDGKDPKIVVAFIPGHLP